MPRLKNTGSMPTPHPGGHWLAGMVIGTTIMAMAAQAIMLGTGVAIKDAAIKDR